MALIMIMMVWLTKASTKALMIWRKYGLMVLIMMVMVKLMNWMNGGLPGRAVLAVRRLIMVLENINIPQMEN